MKIVTGLTTLLAVTVLTATAGAQETLDSAKQAELMAAYMEMAQPGPEHQLLATLAGSWDMELTMWMEPGAEPISAKGVSVARMILGGRFLQTEATTKGEMGGENTSIMGFDRRFGHYTTVGFDSWGTYYVTAAGPYDESTRTITMYGEDLDPVMGFTQKYDMTMRFVSDDEYVFEVIFKDEVNTKGGDPFKMVEIRYTRQKP